MTKGLTYAQFFPSDWRSGTLYKLSIEEEGLYIRSCAYMWDTGEPIPGNDALASKLLNVQIHKYRKTMSALIDKGKMIRGQGVVFNERVMEEIDEYNKAYDASADRVKRGHKTRKLHSEQIKELHETIATLKARLDGEATQSTPHLTPHLTPPVSPGVTPLVTPLVDLEKPKEINEGCEIDHSAFSANPESRIQNKEKNPQTPNGGSLNPKAISGKTVARLAFVQWQEFARAHGLSVPKDTTFETFATAILSRMREHADEPTQRGMLAVWHLALCYVAKSKFLRGMSGDFKADLGMITRPKNFAKLISGGYLNGAGAVDSRWTMQPVSHSDDAKRQAAIRAEIDANNALAEAAGWVIPNQGVTRE